MESKATWGLKLLAYEALKLLAYEALSESKASSRMQGASAIQAGT